MLPLELVTSRLGRGFADVTWHLVPGGFSGARVWRGDRAGEPAIALKAWPPGFPRSRLEEIHRRMRVAARLSFVPKVLAFADGGELVEAAGQVWDATCWMPGMPPEWPSLVDVETAMAAIAELHSVWRDESATIPCPGVRSRVRLMREWLSVPPHPTRYTHLAGGMKETAERAERLLNRVVPAALRALEPVEGVPVHCQPCLRDLRSDHVLFEGGRVGGIVDYGAMAIDDCSVDLARLLGDYEETDAGFFAAGLRAYRAASAGFGASLDYLTQLARTGAIGSAINWLRRLESGGSTAVGNPAVEGRLSRLVRRIEGYAPG